MLVKTKYFGEIDLGEEKVITFPNGIMGFENFKKYTLLYDIDGDKDDFHVSWLQSLDEPSLALPVINPYYIKADYNPIVEDELLKVIDDVNEENLMLLITMTVPSDITKTSVNLKAPFVINTDTRKGIQIIVENQDYEVKYNVYDHIQRLKNQKGER